MIKKLNLYFFDEETISAHDAFWFYGMMGIITFVSLATIGFVHVTI